MPEEHEGDREHERESKSVRVIEDFEDLIAHSKEMMGSGQTDAESGREITMEEEQEEIEELQDAVSELKAGKTQMALDILHSQLMRAEKHIDQPFWNWRPGTAPTDPTEIEQEKRRLQDSVAKIQGLISDLELK
ncbi:MAG: hypothetical protein ABI643_03095 [Candidatus Doudnabacteria bacterium]